jgi:hypothetical protein
VKPAPPSSYAEWVELLHRFERPENDEEVLALLARAKFSLASEMADRLCRRIIVVFEGRVRSVQRGLSTALKRGVDPVEYGRAMTRARHELAPVAAFCAAACWPHEVSSVLQKSLDDFVKVTQTSLEDDATTYARQDQGARLSMVRAFPVSTGAAAQSDAKGSPGTKKPAPETPLPTRRIIL